MTRPARERPGRPTRPRPDTPEAVERQRKRRAGIAKRFLKEDVSEHPPPPMLYYVAETNDIVRYTDVSQAPWFMDRIRLAFGGPEDNTDCWLDGETIRWFGDYFLDVGDWLYRGTMPMSDDVVRATGFRPINDELPEEA